MNSFLKPFFIVLLVVFIPKLKAQIYNYNLVTADVGYNFSWAGGLLSDEDYEGGKTITLNYRYFLTDIIDVGSTIEYTRFQNYSTDLVIIPIMVNADIYQYPIYFGNGPGSGMYYGLGIGAYVYNYVDNVVAATPDRVFLGFSPDFGIQFGITNSIFLDYGVKFHHVFSKEQGSNYFVIKIGLTVGF